MIDLDLEKFLDMASYCPQIHSFVASAAASIATGWSEPVPGRELHPLKSSAFFTAHYYASYPLVNAFRWNSFRIADDEWSFAVALD